MATLLEPSRVRHQLKRWIPDPVRFGEKRWLSLFGRRWRHPNLWHLQRRSAAMGIAIGVFAGFLPIVGQSIVAAAGAIWFRGNLPLAVVFTLVSNPLTMPVLFYGNYRLGAWLLQYRVDDFPREAVEVTRYFHYTDTILVPLFVGSLACGVCAALLAYTVVRVLWRIQVVQRRRRQLRQRSNS